MKKIIFTIAAIFSIFFNIKAANPIPAEVENSFHSKFPHATATVWIAVEEGKYEVDYKCMNYHFHTYFNSEGTILENDLVVNYNTLPDKVHYYIINNLKGLTIQEAIAPQKAREEDHYIIKGTLEGVGYTLHFQSDGSLTKLETI